MNLQEAFDQSVAHLRKQGKKSLFLSGSPLRPDICAYRVVMNGQVCACAVGGLMTDDEYDPSYEKKPLMRLYDGFVAGKFPKLASFFSRYNSLAIISMLVDMQVTHDSTYVEKWESNFQDTARIHGLVYTPPGEK